MHFSSSIFTIVVYSSIISNSLSTAESILSIATSRDVTPSPDFRLDESPREPFMKEPETCAEFQEAYNSLVQRIEAQEITRVDLYIARAAYTYGLSEAAQITCGVLGDYFRPHTVYHLPSGQYRNINERHCTHLGHSIRIVMVSMFAINELSRLPPESLWEAWRKVRETDLLWSPWKLLQQGTCQDRRALL
jgi:hypothetical protein